MLLFSSLCLDVLCTIALNIDSSQLNMYGFTSKDLDLAMHMLERYPSFQKKTEIVATGILA